MLVQDSRKHQPEFDLAEVRGFTLAEGTTRRLPVSISPAHMTCSAFETLQDRCGLRLGPTVATVVFVFGKGKPPRPECTHIGGDPFGPPVGTGRPMMAGIPTSSLLKSILQTPKIWLVNCPETSF